MAASDSKLVVLGRISGLFGVKGWVKVYSYTDPREAILAYREWHLAKNDASKAVRIAEGKKHGKAIIARIADVDDRDEAAAFVDADIAVARAKLPATEEGQYYWTDLEGLRIIDRDGRELGRVAYLLETGANDVLVVQGDREILIPYVKEQVIEKVIWPLARFT